MTRTAPSSAADAPLVSVIVPVFQLDALAAGAVSSLLAQTLRDFEALVIDDGSTDGSGEAARAAWGDDPRFRLIRQANRGLSAARNAGIAQARGAWLAFLDGDDRFAPGFLHRLIGAARAADLPWAASALKLCYPDGTEVAHSGLHGRPDPAGLSEATLPLTDAVETARLFPSAWNKVYRRDMFDGLRFPEGTWFEDHEVYWALAARTGAIRYLPEPLYLHRRGRPGQITGADDERVFEQFAVLDRLQPLVATRARADEGMARLASRLIHERAQALGDQDRRSRFVAAARAWFTGNGLSYGGEGLSPALALELGGDCPLSVVLPLPEGARRDDPALGAARDALSRLPLGLDLLAVGPGRAAAGDWPGLRCIAGDLPQALEAARGRCTLVLPPGSVPCTQGLAALVEAALQGGAELALGQLLTPAGHHDGWMDNRGAPGPGPAGRLAGAFAVRLHPSAGRMVAGTAFLAGLCPLSMPLWHPLAEAELVLRAAAASAATLLHPQPVLRQPAPARIAPRAAARWARALTLPQAAHLPPGWRALLAWRALRPGLPGGPRGALARLAAALVLHGQGLRAPPGAVQADPARYPDRWLARMLGLPPAPP